jgi:uncharacterized membrane protein
MAHTHSHSRAHQQAPPDRRIAAAVWAAAAVALVATIIGLVALWPAEERPTTADAATADDLFGGDPLDARIVALEVVPCLGSTVEDPADCVLATLDVAGQPPGDASDAPTLELSTTGTGATFDVGDEIRVLAIDQGDDGVQYVFYDHDRTLPLWILAAIFVVAVLALGGWKGLGALGGLAASLLVLALFVLPSMLDGNSPVLVAVVGSSAIAFVALYLAHGVSLTTTVALVGTFASLLIVLALSSVFIAAGELTGYTDDASFFLSALGGEIDMRGILLAGFVIGALGVLDDVTVTQVSAVSELRNARPEAERSEIFRSALTIGRDHISSTVNTLVLAYAGAALPLLLLFTQADQPIADVAGREIVATEIVRSLAGSVGIVAAVPITTGLAVFATAGPVRARRRRRATPEPAATDEDAGFWDR